MMVALMFEEILANLGCDVVGVGGSLERGLAIVNDRAIAIDAAILDVNLGGQTSYPIAKRLMVRGVPFVFCTAYGRTGLAPEFAHLPTLAKPFQPDDLRRLLVSTLATADCAIQAVNLVGTAP